MKERPRESVETMLLLNHWTTFGYCPPLDFLLWDENKPLLVLAVLSWLQLAEAKHIMESYGCHLWPFCDLSTVRGAGIIFLPYVDVGLWEGHFCFWAIFLVLKPKGYIFEEWLETHQEALPSHYSLIGVHPKHSFIRSHSVLINVSRVKDWINEMRK